MLIFFYVKMKEKLVVFRFSLILIYLISILPFVLLISNVCKIKLNLLHEIVLVFFFLILPIDGACRFLPNGKIK